MYTRDEVDKRDAEIREEAKQAREIARQNRVDIDRLMRAIEPNGKPGLEERIMGELKAMALHMRNNYQQEDADIEELIKRETSDREKQHAANTEKLDETAKTVARLEKFAYAMGAVFMVFKFFGIENISKIFK